MFSQLKPVQYEQTTLMAKLLYLAVFCCFGLIANLLALELPSATPLLLGNLAFVVVTIRFGLLWGLGCALVVLLPITSPLYWIASLTQLLVLLSLGSKRRYMLAMLLYFALSSVLFFTFPDPNPTLASALLSALIFSFSLMIFKHCARLFLLQSACQQVKRQQPLRMQLASRIAVMAAIPWALMISLLLHGTVVLDLSGAVTHLLSTQHQLHSQLQGKLSAYQAELRLASGYIPLVGDEQSLRQLVHSQPEFISALRTDAAGVVQAFYKTQPQQDIVGHSVAHRDYFQQPSATGLPYVSDVFQGQKLGKDLLFGLSLPLYQQQVFSGVMELSVALQRLTAALQVADTDSTLQLLLMDGQQIKIWGQADDTRPGQKLTTNHPELAASLPYLKHSPFYSHHQLYFNQSGDRIRLQSQIENTNWQLLVLWQYSHLALLYQLLTIISLLAILAGFEFLSRSSQRFATGYTLALQQLIDSIESMKPGSLPRNKPELENSALEFEQLLDSFLALQQRLRASHLTLQSTLEEKTSLSVQLEQRVLERTAELSLERDKATQLAQAKTRFLANMSHELRTPLTIILGYVQQILSKTPQAELQQQLQTIDSHSKFLLQIVNDILDAAKMDEGKLPLEVQAFDLMTLLHELHLNMLPAARAGDLDFMLETRYPLPRLLHTDPLRLKQILMNLIGNAVKFTKAGAVRLCASMQQGQLQLSVSDTGPGISPEQQQKIFAAFEQGDPGISRQFGGTGLGLYICKQLADLLGFSFTLNSTPGKGSQFTLSIPVPVHTELLLQAPQLPPAPEQKQQLSVPQLQGSVLIVDDVADLRQLFSTLLSPTGLSIQTAHHGLDALQKVAHHAFDLILMDMHMPVMDGVTACRELRRQGYQMPVIALTADVQQQQRDLCFEAGCHAVLTKPVATETLYSKVAELMQQQHNSAASNEVQQQLDELSKAYQDTLPQLLAELEHCIQQRLTEPLAALLHRLKGTSACFGFTRISALAADAETALNSDWPELQLARLKQQMLQEQQHE